MKRLAKLTLFVLLSNCVIAQNSQVFVATDIYNFWDAYAKIRSTTASIKLYQQTLY